MIRDTISQAREVDELGIPGRPRVPHLLRDEIATPDHRREARLGSRRELQSRNAATDALPAHGASLDEHQRSFSLAVFCDFDGTFSVQDVGATLAVRHGGPNRADVWAEFERGEIRAWDYNERILGGLPLDAEETEAFLHSVDLDPGARDLLAWCEQREVPFRILSDGFDYNLNHLQMIHGVRFAYTANRLWFDRGTWRIRAGAPDDACGCGTGTCKRGQIEALRARAPGVTTVHIGNGRVSDTCGAVAADVAFAKDSLATRLDALGEPYTAFETLRDVIPALEALL